MILASIDTIPGKNFEVLGIVKGTVVQSKHIGRDILAGLKTIVGGEIQGYTDMLIEARNIATDRMVNEAKTIGADAIIGMRYLMTLYSLMERNPNGKEFHICRRNS